MKEFIYCLSAGIGASWLIESNYLPINNYILYAVFFLLLIIVGLIHEKNKRWKKISLNDAISNELMRIRSDLTEIRVKQDKCGWDNFPDDFLKMEWMYHQYPYIGICETYKDPKGKWGKIIIDLSDSDWFEDEQNNIFDNQFNSETLRKIKSPKKTILKEGMYLTVHIHEDEIVKDYGNCYGKSAKILKIENGDMLEEIILTLEIQLTSKLDYDHYCPSLPDEQELIEKSKIIRKIEIGNCFLHSIRIDNRDNLFGENLVVYWQDLSKCYSMALDWTLKNPYKFVFISTFLTVAIILVVA